VEGTTSFRRPVVAGVSAALIASGVAAVAGMSAFELFCSANERTLDTTGTVVFFAGLVLSLAIVLSRRRAKALVAVLLLGAAIYAGAIAVLAVDGATYTQMCSGIYSDAYTRSLNLTYLYVFWGGALATLLIAAAAVIEKARRSHSGDPGRGEPGPPGNLVPQGTRTA
jgi:glucan phosphoethanolaminetransferase (alkaline phosphatase superfamily)